MEDNRLIWVWIGAAGILLLIITLIDLFTPKSKSCGCGHKHSDHQPNFELSESNIAQLKAMIESEQKPLSKAEKKELLLDLQIAHYRRQEEFSKGNFRGL
jgi:hypothetical protein